MVRHVIVGQKVNPEKVKRSKDLRREMTEEEKILWFHLRNNQLSGFHFHRQQVIDGFIIDYYCHAAKLILEIDGGIHQKQQEYDAERERILKTRGLMVLRISNEEIAKDLYGVLGKITSKCEELTK